MIKIKNTFTSLFLRYALLIITALPNFYIFYLIFTPLTVYPVYFLLNLIFNATLSESTIFINSSSIALIDACIAGSAYYLLFILNMSIPNVKLKQRIKMISFSFAIFLGVNILRIFFTSILHLNSSGWFDFAHKLFWYLGSIIFVVGIWFYEVKIFKIKQIPFYTDLKNLHKKLIK